MEKIRSLIKNVIVLSFIMVSFVNFYHKNTINLIKLIINFPPPESNYVSLYEEKFANIKNRAGHEDTLGYITDNSFNIFSETNAELRYHYYISQFFMAPVLLDYNNYKRKYALLNLINVSSRNIKDLKTIEIATATAKLKLIKLKNL